MEFSKKIHTSLLRVDIILVLSHFRSQIHVRYGNGISNGTSYQFPLEYGTERDENGNF